MCGIVGFCDSESARISDARFDEARDALRHRGPDRARSYEDRGVRLGFRRLSILDLSPAGDQPMPGADGRHVIVFNGEIYNFLELRDELRAEGVTIRGHSDTEVLLALYRRHGVAMLPRLNGMFAFAVYDRVDRTLLLVRDRLGVKPLFFWRRGRCLAFGSELAALRRMPGCPSEIDAEALGLYFRLGVVPEWTCIQSGVRKLPPGTWMRFRVETGEVEGPISYWDLPPVGEEGGRSEGDWLDETEALLWDATRIRLRSDVPLGLFLSGGIDSGLVAAAAAAQQADLTSLTVGFPGESEDEAELAMETARSLGLRPVLRHLDLRQGMGTLPAVIGHFDEPFSDTSALPTSLVCAEARKTLTVVLSGDGGDEVFAGYQNHVRARRWRWVAGIPLRVRRSAASLLARVLPADSRPMRATRKFGEPVARFGMGGRLYPFQDTFQDVLRPEFNLDPRRLVSLYERHVPSRPGSTVLDEAQRLDLRTYLLEDILVKVDRMSMLHSIEVRSPFLDYRLVELGLRLPSSLRVKHGQNKYLLRQLARRHLPPSVAEAPKRGFGIPIESWLLDPSVRAMLQGPTTLRVDPFLPGAAERLWDRARSNPTLLPALLSILCYRWWCQANEPEACFA